MSETKGAIRIGAFQVDFNQVLGKGATGYVYKGSNPLIQVIMPKPLSQ